MTRIAITREVSPSIARCELTHLARAPIDVDLARAQHRAYEALLERLGCEILRLPSDPDLPDSVFVEDTAVVLDEIAIVTRPGAESRRAETGAVADILGRYRELRRIEAPATIDGGDVLRAGRTLYAGLSSRTDTRAVEQLRALARGFEVVAVPFEGCLHLKSAVTLVGERLLLINDAWIDRRRFEGFDFVEVDPAEPFAANALLLEGRVVFPAEHARTRAALERRGIEIVAVEVSELAKAEGGVTCCSVIV